MAENRSTNRVFLLSSVVLGVIAMVAAFVYLENGAGQERGPKSMVLVAKRDLRANTAIDPDKDLTELEIPARLDALKSRSLSPDMRPSYKGQRVNRDILAGTPVMIADLAGAGTLELKGENRAMSVQVKNANALGGLVIPGDYVKLLVTRPVPAPRSARAATAPAPVEGDPTPMDTPAAPHWETITVGTQAFRILAVNQRLSRSRGQLTAADQYQGAGDSSSQQTVTLEVTEVQAKTILEQSGGGTLPITLLVCPAPTTGAPSPSSVAPSTAPTTTPN